MHVIRQSALAQLDLYASSVGRQRLKDFDSTLFRRRKAGAAVFALFAIDDAKFLAIRTRLPGGPFLHRQKREQTRNPKRQVEYGAANFGFHREIIPSAQPPSCQGADSGQDDA